ncbi:MAG TPA: hypothetical protein PLT54_14175, partial [Rhodoferax sp.]|nr:hypothetical protein [Rhodoferax sp.]
MKVSFRGMGRPFVGTFLSGGSTGAPDTNRDTNKVLVCDGIWLDGLRQKKPAMPGGMRVLRGFETQ